MIIKKSLDKYSLAEVYNNIRECECQVPTASVNTTNNSEKVEMVFNNLVNINNKSAELIQSMQCALDSNEDIEHWVTEKIAVMANLIGTLADYYIKYKNVAPEVNSDNNINIQNMNSTSSLKLEPMTVATSFPLNTNMPPMIASF